MPENLVICGHRATKASLFFGLSATCTCGLNFFVFGYKIIVTLNGGIIILTSCLQENL